MKAPLQQQGYDAFLSVKTKSLCYQAFPVLKERENVHEAQVLVISPLIAIMEENCKSLQNLGFSATYIGRNDSEASDIQLGKFQFLFATPETIVGIKGGDRS